MVADLYQKGKALNTGLRRAMEDDPKVVLLGEDIGKVKETATFPDRIEQISMLARRYIRDLKREGNVETR